jgi:carbamoyl-phosphate synthase large subunit
MTMEERSTVLVTATGGPAGLAAIRSLQRVGEFKLIAVDADSLAPGLYAKEVIPYTVPLAKEQSYVDVLFDICEKEEVKVVLPCSDEEIYTLSKSKPFFDHSGIEMPISDHNLIVKASDKWKLILSISKFGIRVPETFCPTTIKEFEETIRKMDFPIVVRPRVSRGARGVTFCENKNEAMFAFRLLNRKYSGVIVQEVIPGGSGSVFVVQTLWDKQHALCATAVMQKLRERPSTGGVAVAGKTVHNDQLRDLGVSVIKKLGPWTGPAGVELKISTSDGQPYVMEVNPRLQGVTYLFTKAGINFPHLWVLVALDKKFTPQLKYEEQYFTRYWNDVVIGEEDLIKAYR